MVFNAYKLLTSFIKENAATANTLPLLIIYILPSASFIYIFDLNSREGTTSESNSYWEMGEVIVILN